MIGVTWLIQNLLALLIFAKYPGTPQRQLRSKRQAVAYLMGYVSDVVFGSVLWG